MTDVLNSLKYPKMKKIFCLTLTLALLLMMFLPLQQSSAADPVGASYTVNGRRLSAASAGDTSDWIEIAQYTHTDGTSYSLIVRENYTLTPTLVVVITATQHGNTAPTAVHLAPII